MSEGILSCLPERLHPVSRMFLEIWLAGDLSTVEFLRWFHMPNSDYLPVAVHSGGRVRGLRFAVYDSRIEEGKESAGRAGL